MPGDFEPGTVCNGSGFIKNKMGGFSNRINNRGISEVNIMLAENAKEMTRGKTICKE